jgi:hypothetical protein
MGIVGHPLEIAARDISGILIRVRTNSMSPIPSEVSSHETTFRHSVFEYLEKLSSFTGDLGQIFGLNPARAVTLNPNSLA